MNVDAHHFFDELIDERFNTCRQRYGQLTTNPLSPVHTTWSDVTHDALSFAQQVPRR